MTRQADERVVYPPLDTLKPVTDNVWIVDSGPLRTMGIAIPVRMTVVRLPGGEMWLHSPTRYDPALKAQIERIGTVRHLVAPTMAHWSFLQDWASACPDATVWAAPDLRDRRPVKRSGFRIDADLSATPPAVWADTFDHAVFSGAFGFNEVAFFHRPSRTLVLTDLIQNFEPAKLPLVARPVVALLGALAPDGGTPRHVRLVLNAKRRDAAAAARRVLDWRPDRVIFAHGRWFDQDATPRLERAFRWLLG